MNGFAALLRLQLLSRLADLKPRNLRAQLKDKKAKTIGMLFAYVLLIVYVLGFLIYIENAVLNLLIPAGIPDLLLTIAVLMSMVSTLILSFFFVLSSLYFSRDTAFISSLPVSPRTVLAAKLTHIWLSETGVSGLFLLPACILYGVKMGVDALFYVRMLLIWMGVAVLPIVIISFLSTLLIRLSALWKRREMVATVGGIALLIAYMILCMNMGSIMGGEGAEDMIVRFFSDNQARIEAITQFFPPASWAVKGLGGDWSQLVLFLAVCALAAAFTIWVLGYFYQGLSLLQSETPTLSRRSHKANSYTGTSAFKACCQREIRQIFRVPAYATNILPIALMPLLMTGVMVISFNRGFSEQGESIQSMLSGVNGGLILAIMTAIMCFMAGMNPALSSSVTREGKGHDFLTALPVSPRTIALSKMAVGFGLSVLGCLPAAVVLAVAVPEYTFLAVGAFILSLLYCYTSGAIALANDIANPKLDWLTETEAIKQKSGTLIGMLLGWAILIALGIISYFLLDAGADTLIYGAVMLVILLLSAWGAHRLLLKTAEKKYCQG